MKRNLFREPPQRNRLHALVAAAAATALIAVGPAIGGGMKAEDVNAMFKKADANADGKVTREELQAMDPTLAEIFDQADKDKDGKLTNKEFGELFS